MIYPYAGLSWFMPVKAPAAGFCWSGFDRIFVRVGLVGKGVVSFFCGWWSGFDPQRRHGEKVEVFLRDMGSVGQRS